MNNIILNTDREELVARLIDRPESFTDEELEQFQKQEERKVTVIGDIIDFIVSFFR